MKEVSITVSENDLSLIGDNVLNREQLSHILKKTPEKYVKTRPAKGGGVWRYVSAGYVKKCLNLMFGWDWDFEIVENTVMHGEVIVKGRLTCRSGNRTIVKMQYGNKEVMCKKGTDIPLSIGNDMKSAASDALKKCASEIGIASDIYNAEEFREVKVVPNDSSEIELIRINKFLDKCNTIDDVEILEESLSGQDVSETVSKAIAAKKSELKLNLQ